MHQAQCNYSHQQRSIYREIFFLDERLTDKNKSYYKVPSPEGACLALNGRNKLRMNPERETIGIS